MASLGSHVNVWSTCLELLHRRGWILRELLSPAEDGMNGWEAVKGDIDLVADNPIELLGLAAIHDEILPAKHTPYWWSIAPPAGEEEVGDRLRREALAAREARVATLRRLRAEDPETWREELRRTLENSGSDDDAAGVLGIPTRELRDLLADPLVAPFVREWGWS